MDSIGNREGLAKAARLVSHTPTSNPRLTQIIQRFEDGL